MGGSSSKLRYDKTINFVFVRHGIGCHNYKTDYGYPCPDAPLSNDGIIATTQNTQLLKQKLENRNILNFDIFGSSPLIRSIETSHYIKSEFGVNETEPVYIFPFLRELNESVLDRLPYDKYEKFSPRSLKKINSTAHPAYNMLPLEQQKLYMRNRNININSKYVENNTKGRDSPGDILLFIRHFITNILKDPDFINQFANKNVINVLIVTHSGVLRDYCFRLKDDCGNTGFKNNDGFIVTVGPDKYTYKLLELESNFIKSPFSQNPICTQKPTCLPESTYTQSGGKNKNAKSKKTIPSKKKKSFVKKKKLSVKKKKLSVKKNKKATKNKK